MEARVLVDMVFFFFWDLGFLGEIGRQTMGDIWRKREKREIIDFLPQRVGGLNDL